MDIDAQIVQFRLLICSTKVCAYVYGSSAEGHRKEKKSFLCLSAILTRASLRQQPQAKAIGHSPKGGQCCLKANNKLTS